MAKKLKKTDRISKRGRVNEGKPRRYNTPEEMQAAIDKYFKSTKKLTVCGLAISLGFIDRHALDNYDKYSPEFHATIKKAKFRIEEYLEKTLLNGKPVGTIFNLKNNFGWKDKHDIGMDGTIEVTIKQY